MPAPASDLPFLDPAHFKGLHKLQLAARAIVDGLNTGSHRSPYKGHSVDFADHRPYVPGDDLRHLDWKVLGRSDRLVLKRYEAETDLACTVVVDASASMAYQGEDAALSKYAYAATLAASLSHLALEQQDRAGLMIFADGTEVDVAPARQGQLERICQALRQREPGGGTVADEGLLPLGQPAYRKGLVVVLSDLMIDPAELRRGIDRLAHRGHDVAVIWVLDPQERDLSVPAVSRFRGLEGEGEVVAEPRSLRQAYREEVERHRVAVETICRSRGVLFIECLTDQPFTLPLNQLLVGLHHSPLAR